MICFYWHAVLGEAIPMYQCLLFVTFFFLSTNLASAFTVEKGNWQTSLNPRVAADVNGDGRADIIGFSNTSVVTALGQKDGTFARAKTAYPNAFTVKHGGWSVSKHPRLVADVNGDGYADIVGFANAGVVTALGKKDGTFARAKAAYPKAFTVKHGGWSVSKHPRLVADVNGDGYADIIGFANAGVVTALGKKDGTFARVKAAYPKAFTVKHGGWSVSKHPRLVADVNGDGYADIIGFANAGVVTALGKKDGTFKRAKAAYKYTTKLDNLIDNEPNVTKVIPLNRIPKEWPSTAQSISSIKHRITQYSFVAVTGDQIRVKYQIRNKDRTRGRTMCTEVQLRDLNNDVHGSSFIRAGIKRRGNHTRWRRVDHTLEISPLVDRSTASVWIFDTYCPKGGWSRLGRTAGKFVKKPIRESLRTSGQIVRAIGKTKDQLIAETSAQMKKIGGSGLQKAFDDVASLTRIVDDKLVVSILSGAQAFVNDGNPKHLDPIVAVGVSRIASSRAELRRKASPVPLEVLNLLPEDIRESVSSARFIEKRRVPELSQAHMGLSDATAIVMDDVIIFRDGQVPNVETPDGRRLWAHELFHVHQYKEAGLRGFTARYLGNELGFHSRRADGRPAVNPIEEEADLFACKIAPGGTPTYIERCP